MYDLYDDWYTWYTWYCNSWFFSNWYWLSVITVVAQHRLDKVMTCWLVVVIAPLLSFSAVSLSISILRCPFLFYFFAHHHLLVYFHTFVHPPFLLLLGDFDNLSDMNAASCKEFTYSVRKTTTTTTENPTYFTVTLHQIRHKLALSLIHYEWIVSPEDHGEERGRKRT